MTAINGSVTNANPGPTLWAALEASFIAAGFTVVDTVVITTETYKVLKSAAADNAFNLDWYLVLKYPTTGAGTWGFQILENYDPATDLGYRGGQNNIYEPLNTTDYSIDGATGKVLSTWYFNQVSLPTTAFTYRFSITTDRVIATFSNASQSVFYAGFYQPTADFEDIAGSLMYPLIVTDLSSNSQYTGGGQVSITRLPLVTASPDIAVDSFFQVGLPTNQARSIGRGFPSTPGGGDFGGPLAYDVEIWNNQAGVIGRLIDMLGTNGNPSMAGTVVFGDTTMVTTNPDYTGGDVYTFSRYTNYYGLWLWKEI